MHCRITRPRRGISTCAFIELFIPEQLDCAGYSLGDWLHDEIVGEELTECLAVGAIAARADSLERLGAEATPRARVLGSLLGETSRR